MNAGSRGKGPAVTGASRGIERAARPAGMPGRFAARVLLAGGLLLAACDGKESAPGDDVAGHYEATTWSLVENSISHDLLDEGGSLSMTLHPDGTATGAMVLPAEHVSAGEETVSFSGNFVHDAVAATVTFTFLGVPHLPELPWTAEGNRLTGSRHVAVGNGELTIVHVVLER